jgi:hypothetical protein
MVEWAELVGREVLEAGVAGAGVEARGGGEGAVRRGEHLRHEILVRTTYEIAVDGRAFDVAVNVDNAGRVHYDGLPTWDFASVMDLVAKVIDQFPDDFG